MHAYLRLMYLPFPFHFISMPDVAACWPVRTFVCAALDSLPDRLLVAHAGSFKYV